MPQSWSNYFLSFSTKLLTREFLGHIQTKFASQQKANIPTSVSARQLDLLSNTEGLLESFLNVNADWAFNFVYNTPGKAHTLKSSRPTLTVDVIRSSRIDNSQQVLQCLKCYRGSNKVSATEVSWKKVYTQVCICGGFWKKVQP